MIQMDFLKPIVRDHSFRYFMRRDGYDTRARERELAASQFLPNDRVAALQHARLKELLRHCSQNHRYYCQRFQEAGFNPDHFEKLDDIAKLPILTKDEIRAAGDRLFSDGYSTQNSSHRRTGGSTGVPLHTASRITCAPPSMRLVCTSTCAWAMACSVSACARPPNQR